MSVTLFKIFNLDLASLPPAFADQELDVPDV